MDGLKTGPILIGSYDITNSNQWLDAVAPVIQARIASYANTENDFNLLLITENIQPIIESKISSIDSILQTNLEESIRTQYQYCKQEFVKYNNQQQIVKQKQKAENIKRRHNYVPFIFALLNELILKKVTTTTVNNNVNGNV